LRACLNLINKTAGQGFLFFFNATIGILLTRKIKRKIFSLYIHKLLSAAIKDGLNLLNFFSFFVPHKKERAN
jgi:hypothetical protein